MRFIKEYEKERKFFEDNVKSVVSSFFDITTDGYFLSPSFKNYIPQNDITFFDPKLAFANIPNLNYELNECISDFLFYLSFSFLKTSGIDVSQGRRRRMFKIKNGTDVYHALFVTHQFYYLDSKRRFRLQQLDSNHLLAKDTLSGLCKKIISGKIEGCTDITVLVFGNALLNVEPDDATREGFKQFKGVKTAIGFLSDFLDKETLSYYQKVIISTIHSVINKAVVDYTERYFNLDILLPSNNKISFEKYRIEDDFEGVIQANLRRMLNHPNKPQWCVAFETAEWLWYRFKSVKYFDNSFIASQYYKSFDLFFKTILAKYISIPETATLGESIGCLRAHSKEFGLAKAKRNSSFRAEYFASLNSYLTERNEYTHHSIEDAPNFVTSARKATIELMALTVYLYGV